VLVVRPTIIGAAIVLATIFVRLSPEAELGAAADVSGTTVAIAGPTVAIAGTALPVPGVSRLATRLSLIPHPCGFQGELLRPGRCAPLSGQDAAAPHPPPATRLLRLQHKIVLGGLTAGEETPPLRRQHDRILLLYVDALQILLTGPLDGKTIMRSNSSSSRVRGRPLLVLLGHGGVAPLPVMMPPVRIPDSAGIPIDRVEIGRPPLSHGMLLELKQQRMRIDALRARIRNLTNHLLLPRFFISFTAI